MAAVAVLGVAAAAVGVMSESGWLWGHPERGRWLVVAVVTIEAGLLVWWTGRHFSQNRRLVVAVGWLAATAAGMVLFVAVGFTGADTLRWLTLLAAAMATDLVGGVVCLAKGRDVAGLTGLAAAVAPFVAHVISLATFGDSWAPSLVGDVVGTAVALLAVVPVTLVARLPARPHSPWARAPTTAAGKQG